MVCCPKVMQQRTLKAKELMYNLPCFFLWRSVQLISCISVQKFSTNEFFAWRTHAWNAQMHLLELATTAGNLQEPRGIIWLYNLWTSATIRLPIGFEPTAFEADWCSGPWHDFLGFHLIVSLKLEEQMSMKWTHFYYLNTANEQHWNTILQKLTGVLDK